MYGGSVMYLSRVVRYVSELNGVDCSRLIRLAAYRLRPILQLYFTIITELRYRTQLHTKGIHPRKRYTTCPENIQHLLAPDTAFSVANSGEIHDGDWDLQARPFNEYLIYNSLRKRFVHDYDWEDTEQFEQAAETIRSGGSCWHGCRSLQDLHERCSYLDALYADISEDGYTPQSDLTVRRHENASIYPPSLREVSVAVGRNGKLILVDGRHRLSMVKIAGIDQILIQIAIVHAEWDGGLPAGVAERTLDSI